MFADARFNDFNAIICKRYSSLRQRTCVICHCMLGVLGDLRVPTCISGNRQLKEQAALLVNKSLTHPFVHPGRKALFDDFPCPLPEIGYSPVGLPHAWQMRETAYRSAISLFSLYCSILFLVYYYV